MILIWDSTGNYLTKKLGAIKEYHVRKACNTCGDSFEPTLLLELCLE